MAYEITIESPSTGCSVAPTFTVTGTAEDDTSKTAPAAYKVICSITGGTSANNRSQTDNFTASPWSFSFTANPDTYTIRANLYVLPTDPANGDPADDLANITDVTVAAAINLLDVDISSFSGPGMAARAAGLYTVKGIVKDKAATPTVYCIVDKSRGHKNKKNRSIIAVSMATFSTTKPTEWTATIQLPAGNPGVRALALDKDGKVKAITSKPPN